MEESTENLFRVGRKIDQIKILNSMGNGGKPEGKRPLGRPRLIWEDNIKMDLQEVGGGSGDWMDLVQIRERWRALVSTVMNFRVP